MFYFLRMSLAEILDEIPKLSFADRQALIRRAVELDDEALTPDEETILDERLEDFRSNPDAGVSLEELKSRVLPR
jgi:hypothetical protein